MLPAGPADALAALILAALAWTDLRRHRLPRPLMAGLVLAGFLSTLLRDGPAGLPPALLSAALAGLPLLLLRRAIGRRWPLGGGDIRLAAALGLWLGAATALPVLAAGAMLAVAWGGLLQLLGRPDRVPYGTACALALLLLAGLGQGPAQGPGCMKPIVPEFDAPTC